MESDSSSAFVSSSDEDDSLGFNKHNKQFIPLYRRGNFLSLLKSFYIKYEVKYSNTKKSIVVLLSMIEMQIFLINHLHTESIQMKRVKVIHQYLII